MVILLSKYSVEQEDYSMEVMCLYFVIPSEQSKVFYGEQFPLE